MKANLPHNKQAYADNHKRTRKPNSKYDCEKMPNI